MRTTALIVAAGRGERLGGEAPKQFQPCAGQPLAWHALDRFCRSGEIDDLVVVLPAPSDLDRYLGGAGAWPLPVRAVAGGAERQDSVAAGLAVIDGDGLVLVHDAARPLISRRVIRDVRRAAAGTGAAVPGLACADTIKEADGGRILSTVDRRCLVRVQTPQGFRVEVLRRAHRRAREDGFTGSDDAALVERLGAAVALVEGAEENLKVTRPGDLDLVEALLASAGRRSGGGQP
jgi:2-C-methyl-D-erythritol 4-phosphate cytidylyltransferase